MDLTEHAEQLQALNRFARKVYIVCMVLFLVTSALLFVLGDRDYGAIIVTMAVFLFFLGLSAYNERIIRRLRKAGIK